MPGDVNGAKNIADRNVVRPCNDSCPYRTPSNDDGSSGDDGYHGTADVSAFDDPRPDMGCQDFGY
jgi:hypothetical protein